jgi:predicted RecA/RadA family phage recombinase
VAAGDVVVQGQLIGVAKRPIAANVLGALAVGGVFDVVKKQEAFATVGAPVYWDADGDPYGGEAGSGAATATESSNTYMGEVVKATGADDATVRVRIRSRTKVRQLVQVAVEDLGAGADISARPIFVSPTACTLLSAGILTQGAPAGIDDSNTCVLALKNDGGDTIVTKTYNTATQPPDGDYEDLGGLDADHKVLSAGEHVTLDVTQGTTADMPAFVVVLEYELTIGG